MAYTGIKYLNSQNNSEEATKENFLFIWLQGQKRKSNIKLNSSPLAIQETNADDYAVS